jgi:transposase
LTVAAANIAKHYGVEIAVCPPRRAQRKGVVEKACSI